MEIIGIILFFVMLWLVIHITNDIKNPKNKTSDEEDINFYKPQFSRSDAVGLDVGDLSTAQGRVRLFKSLLATEVLKELEEKHPESYKVFFCFFQKRNPDYSGELFSLREIHDMQELKVTDKIRMYKDAERRLIAKYFSKLLSSPEKLTELLKCDHDLFVLISNKVLNHISRMEGSFEKLREQESVLNEEKEIIQYYHTVLENFYKVLGEDSKLHNQQSVESNDSSYTNNEAVDLDDQETTFPNPQISDTKAKSKSAYVTNSKRLLNICNDLISEYEDKNNMSPSCREDLIESIKYQVERSKAEISQWKDYDTDYIRIAHTMLANSSFDLLASGKYNIYTGVINPMKCGSQLLNVYDRSMEWAVSHKEIDEPTRIEQRNYLMECISKVG